MKGELPENRQDLSAGTPRSIPRRTFLDLVFSSSILLTVLAIVGVVWRFLWPRSLVFGGRKVFVGSLDQIPIGGSVRKVINGQGVLVVRTKTYFAGLSLNCTHTGCNVKWDAEREVIVCPCHGGFFDLYGNVLGGPPPRPLKQFIVSVLENKVFIEDNSVRSERRRQERFRSIQ